MCKQSSCVETARHKLAFLCPSADLSYNPVGIITMTVPLSSTLNYLRVMFLYCIVIFDVALCLYSYKLR